MGVHAVGMSTVSVVAVMVAKSAFIGSDSTSPKYCRDMLRVPGSYGEAGDRNRLSRSDGRVVQNQIGCGVALHMTDHRTVVDAETLRGACTGCSSAPRPGDRGHAS